MIESTFLTTLLSTLPAYMDPGTGSYVLQVLIAALLGAAFVVKMYWTKIKLGIRNLFNKDGSKPGDES